MCYIYTIEYYLAIKKNKICDNIDGPRGYYAKFNKLEKEKYCMISLIHEVQKSKK